MTAEQQDILEDFYDGNSKTIRVTITDDDGNLKPLADCEMTYVLFGRPSVPLSPRDKDIEVRKSSFNGNSEIKVISTGICEIYLTPPDTLDKYGTFRHHLNVVDEDGKEETVLTGKVVIHRAPAKRYRRLGASAYLQGEAS